MDDEPRADPDFTRVGLIETLTETDRVWPESWEYEIVRKCAETLADAILGNASLLDAIAEKVLAVRKERFTRSFEIECPECGTAPGHCCMNLGSGGGPMNHMARINAEVG